MKYSLIRYALTAIILFISLNLHGQTTMPDELKKNTLKEQLKYLEDRTRIYENYRAIREDMFQQIKENVMDTLLLANGKINVLNNSILILNHSIDSLNTTLSSTKSSLEETTRTKNSIRVFGLEVNKLTYNSIMWMTLAGLLALLGFGFLIFQRTLSVTSNTKKEFAELKVEFEAYRKTSREAREKMSMDHFNEIKRLKGV